MSATIRLVLFVLLSSHLAISVIADERILSYHSRIHVEEDGTLDVVETIIVRAEGKEIRRGIFRDLPVLYQARLGLKQRRPFEVVETTRDGVSEPHQVEDHKAGVRIRIGRADQFLTPGEYSYTIHYRSGGQLLFFDEHDELYWNVTGDEWAFPIDSASAEVILPDGVAALTCDGYIGRRGSKETASIAEVEGNRAELAAGRILSPGEGLTLAVTWPSRSLDTAAYERSPLRLFRENPSAIGGIALLVLMFLWHVVAWVMVGRDPAPGRIIPQFGPPEGFSPAAVRMLDRMSFDNTCFSAAVLGLGVKGVLEIGGSDKNIVLERTDRNPRSPLTPDERALYDKLLVGRKSIELKQSNHRIVSGGRSALQKSLAAQLEKSHFFKNALYWVPGFLLSLAAVGLLVLNSGELEVVGFLVLWLSIWSVGTGALLSSTVSQWRGGSKGGAVFTGLFSVPFVIAWLVAMGVFFFQAGPLTAGAFLFAVVVNALFYHWIKAPTHLGRKVLDHIEGFRHYLSVAEEDRLGGFAGPEKTPELFETMLPYAHALGVEQEWSARFRDVLARAGQAEAGGGAYRPRYYSGSYTGMDRTMTAAALGGALTSALTSASKSPSSSGSGGGGSSGGGGGGGGGGGW